MRTVEIDLQNTIELRVTASEIITLKPDFDARAIFKGFLEGKLLAWKWWQITAESIAPNQRKQRAALTTLAIPFTLRERSESYKTKWNSIGNSSTSNICNPIYSKGTILQTQIIWNSIGNLSTSTTAIPFKTILQLQMIMEFCRPQCTKHRWNPIYIVRMILKLQITMKFCRPQCTKPRWKPIYNAEPIRAWSENDPTTRPSHRGCRSWRFAKGVCMGKQTVSFVHLLSLKNVFCTRLSSKLHR